MMPHESPAPLPPDRRKPHPSRLDPGRADFETILAAHEAAMSRGSATYVDPPTGCLVFTAQALWDRGSCCEAGCRHCPYLDRRQAR